MKIKICVYIYIQGGKRKRRIAGGEEEIPQPAVVQPKRYERPGLADVASGARYNV